jgi:hypothetical protein
MINSKSPQQIWDPWFRSIRTRRPDRLWQGFVALGNRDVEGSGKA